MYRIKALLSPARHLVKFNEVFEGTKNGFLNLIDGNIPHGSQDHFSFGTIYGAEITRYGEPALSFMKGGFWNFSTMDQELMFKVYEGIARNKEFAFGMYIDEVRDVKCDFNDGLNYVSCHPGIVLRKFKQEGGVNNMSLFGEENDFLAELEKHTREKVKRIAPYMNSKDIYINAVDGEIYKKKSAFVEGAYHIFTEGTFSVEADKEVVDLLSCVGLGDLTYLGFGYMAQAFEPKGKQFGNRTLRGNEIRYVSGDYVRGENLREDYDRNDY